MSPEQCGCPPPLHYAFIVFAPLGGSGGVCSALCFSREGEQIRRLFRHSCNIFEPSVQVVSMLLDMFSTSDQCVSVVTGNICQCFCRLPLPESLSPEVQPLGEAIPSCGCVEPLR